MSVSQRGVALFVGVLATLGGSGDWAQERPESAAASVTVADWLARFGARLPPADMQVPRRPVVVSLPYDSASIILQRLSITIVRRDTSASTAPKGIVVGQRPAAGTPIRPGAVDTLWVAAGPLPTLNARALRAADSLRRLRPGRVTPTIPQWTRPSVVSLPYDSGEAVLRRLFITVVARDSFAPEAGRGVILAQRPSAGTPVRRGDVDTLWVSGAPRRVTVPDVRGENYRVAVGRVYQARLIPAGPALSADDSSRAVVSRQTPEAPGPAPANSIVRLEVTLDRRVPVPDVVGRDTLTAGAILVRAGLQRGAVRVGFEEGAPPGRVFHQDPGAGDLVPPDTPVQLWMSRVPSAARVILVPRVVGLPLEGAREVLAEVKLEVGHVDTVEQESNTGLVVHQSPHAEDTARAGGQVLLRIAVAGPTAVVPLLSGLGLQEAGDTLAALGLRLGDIRSGRDPSRPDNVVVGQSVPAGSRLARGRTVDIDLNRLPGRVRVPAVVGLQREQAGDTLRRAGLAVGAERERSEGGTGRVLEQEPPAGAVVDSGAPVNLVVDAPPFAPRLLVVPPVVDSAVPAAIATVVAQGLIHVVVDSEPVVEPALHPEDLLAWTIASQAPAAGELVPPLTLVQLVASATPMRPVPSLRDMSDREAEDEAQAHGFSIRMNRRLGLRFATSRVVDQAPDAGQFVPLSQLVITAVVAEPIPLPVSIGTAVALLAGIGALLRRPARRREREPRPEPTYHADVQAEPPELGMAEDTDLIKADLSFRVDVAAEPPQLVSERDDLIKPEARHHA